MQKTQNTKQVKAMKRYICQLCGKPILRGTYYMAETQLERERHITLRRHIHCDAMLDACLKFHIESRIYTEQQIVKSLREKLCKCICAESEQLQCDGTDTLACELCQERLLSPVIFKAAKQSVKDSFEWGKEDF